MSRVQPSEHCVSAYRDTQRVSFMRNPAKIRVFAKTCASVPGCSSMIVGVCIVIYYIARCMHCALHTRIHTWHHHQLPPIFLRLVHKSQSDLGNCTRLSNYLSSVRLFFHSFIKNASFNNIVSFIILAFSPTLIFFL